ncbi:MAG: hypothetical protein SGJ10_07610 [Bacteroidota bacterium]|nr:hypothetical protein [Bacteroidota bacterium]
MKKINLYYIFLLVVFTVPVQGQLYIRGKLLKSSDSTPVVQAIVVPQGLYVGTVSSYNGEFRLAVDSIHKQLIVKKLGYQTVSLQLDSLLGKNNIIYMESIPQLFPEFVFRTIRTPKVDAYERRKEWSYVLDRPKPGFQSPISLFYYNYSKHGRELKKLEELFERDEKKHAVNDVFTRDIAHQISGLYGTALDSFMNFCGPTYNLVATTSEYEIIETIKRCYMLHKILFKNE